MAQQQKRTISVVVPIYNGEKYLAQTLDSILAQSFEDFEVLCTDDCSSDASRAIVEEYAERDERVRPITVPRNLGSAAKAVNHALPYACGDFFVYSSQDDLHSRDWLARMHGRAVETGAEAVIPDVVFYYEQEPARNRSMIGIDGNRDLQLTGREALEKSLDWRIAGNALWNMATVRKLGFEEFSANSDEYSVRRFFIHCNKVVFSEGIFYYRQDNENAITKKRSPNSFDWPYTQLRVAELLQEHSFPKTLVAREVAGAISEIARLQEWLGENGAKLSAQELELMVLKINRFEERLISHHHQLTKEIKRQKGAANQLVAKWTRSLRKLPGKCLRLCSRPAQGSRHDV